MVKCLAIVFLLFIYSCGSDNGYCKCDAVFYIGQNTENQPVYHVYEDSDIDCETGQPIAPPIVAKSFIKCK